MSEAPRETAWPFKDVLRHGAVALSRTVLAATSPRYEPADGPTIVIAPHPDDESLGCGGVIARKRYEGRPVEVVYITDGSASHPGHPRHPPAEIAALRRAEARRALFALGVEQASIHCLDEPDGTLARITADRRENLVARLEAILRPVRPAEVFFPCSPDGSSEHDATSRFVLEAVRRLGWSPILWQYPVWSWWNPSILMRCRAASMESRRLPLEDFAHAKAEAIACYATQIRPLAPDPHAALPASLLEIFRGDSEYFFRCEPPDPA